MRRAGQVVLRRLLIPALVALVLTAGCEVRATAVAPTTTAPPAPTEILATGTAVAPPPTLSPTPDRHCATDGAWSLELSITGGLIGVDQTLRLDHTGEYQADDNRAKISRAGTLAPDQLADLVEQLPAVCSTVAAVRPPVCADCYVYALRATLGAERFEVFLNDVNLGQAPAGELVGTLRRLLTTALGE